MRYVCILDNLTLFVCIGILGDDMIVGDPLYTVPLYLANTTLPELSMCYEIHGSVDEVYNLVSDRCVSVNALYVSMVNPEDGNVINKIGIKAVSSRGEYVHISVALDNDCVPRVEAQELLNYTANGISVKKLMNRVRVSVPNCENNQLVMWMECKQIAQQPMLDFVITRGLNLRPTSHGLLGKTSIVWLIIYVYDTCRTVLEYSNISGAFSH